MKTLNFEELKSVRGGRTLRRGPSRNGGGLFAVLIGFLVNLLSRLFGRRRRNGGGGGDKGVGIDF